MIHAPHEHGRDGSTLTIPEMRRTLHELGRRNGRDVMNADRETLENWLIADLLADTLGTTERGTRRMKEWGHRVYDMANKHK